MDKKIWIFIGSVVIILAGVLVFSRKQEDPYATPAEQIGLFDATQFISEDSLPEGFDNSGETPATSAENFIDHYGGNPKAKVVLIEYGDFSCSHCAQYSAIMKVARKKYQNDAVFVYRYFLLGGAYVNSTAAATAVEAAARQDKFWEMHDLVYETQSAWSSVGADVRKSVFQEYAKEVGVDIEQWSEDYDNYKTNGIKTRIDFNISLARQINLTGTPTLMINGYKLDPSNKAEDVWSTQDKLNTIIEKYIAQTKEDN